MPIRVVTLSHATGAGGDTIGHTVAKGLGFRYMDEEIIELAAQREGVETAVVADEERRKSFFERLLAGIADPPMGDASVGMIMPEAILTRSETLRADIVQAIHDVAAQGRVVIVSHAASIPLAERADVLRVWITASPATRAERVARDRKMAAGDAVRFVKDSDAGRADYFQRFYRIDHELPTHYDLVINTDKLTAEEAVDLVVAAVGRHR